MLKIGKGRLDRLLVRLGDQAYARIRQMISDGWIPTRTVVRESYLARQLGVSRTPVREALQRLVAEGYLSAIPQGGYFVVQLSIGDLEDVYEVRGVLEGLAARRAADHATRTDLAQLEDLYEAMEGARARGDDAQLARLNSQFHATVARGGGNAYLQSMLGEIREIFERFRPAALTHPGRREAAHAEHRGLLEALRARDVDGAERLAQQHVRGALAVRLEIEQQLAEAVRLEAEQQLAERAG